MSRGKGRMSIIPRRVIDKTTKPGLSQGERRQIEKFGREGFTPLGLTGGAKRNKVRAKITRKSRRRNRRP